MKKVLGIMLGLSLVIGTASISFAQEKKEEGKSEEGKKKKGKKKKSAEEEKKPY